jgi:hypothetical protein
MKKIELREMLVVRCDVCGKECGSYVTFNTGRSDEKHACADWNEALGARCEEKMRKDLAKAARGPSAPIPPSVDGPIVRELVPAAGAKEVPRG